VVVVLLVRCVDDGAVVSRVVDAVVEMVRPYRQQASWWAVGGVVLAGGTAPVAAARLGIWAAAPYLLVAVAMATLAVGCCRAWRWALVVTGLALGAQLVDVVGASWAVAANPGGSKADELRQLGITPRLAFAVNLLYSSLAAALFLVILLRARTHSPEP
jgi:hypothetical protein